MTKEDAEAFLDRNPAVRTMLAEMTSEAIDRMDVWYAFGSASNAEDAKINCIEVYRAIYSG